MARIKEKAIDRQAESNARGKIYALVSYLYKDVADSSGGDHIRGVLEECNSFITPQTNEAGEALAEHVISAENESALSLNQQYTLLFLTPNGVHPYESVYRGTKKRLMDEPWRRVKDFYREAGIEKGNDEEHPEDHLAVELGFMAYLAFASSEVTAKDELLNMLVVQKDFLSAHLLEWVPALCADIKSTQDVPVYHALADFTISFLEEDSRYISGLLEN